MKKQDGHVIGNRSKFMYHLLIFVIAYIFLSNLVGFAYSDSVKIETNQGNTGSIRHSINNKWAECVLKGGSCNPDGSGLGCCGPLVCTSEGVCQRQ